MSYTQQPTLRSPNLFLSLPTEILQSLIHIYLTDTLYTTLFKSQSYPQVISLSTLITATTPLRGINIHWTHATRTLLFHKRQTRHNLLLKLPRLLSSEDVTLFPNLRDCIVELCHPYEFHLVYSTLFELEEMIESYPDSASHPLAYVSSITWCEDNFITIYQQSAAALGYAPMGTDLMTSFITQCMSSSLKLATDRNARPNGGSVSDSLALKEDGLAAMAKFFYKEILALWYYNAHYVRQILSLFPNLEEFVLPAWLHVPFLARRELFIPEMEDETVFAPVVTSPPSVLESLKLVYEDRGKSYEDLISNAKAVTVNSAHYNPVLGMFPRRYRRMPVFSHSFLVFNKWVDGFQCDVGEDVIELLTMQLDKIVADIESSGVETVVDVEGLRGMLQEPYK
ncbi:hypothetical protein BJX70DRAFT_355655 [Aspergillus crustosus]